MTGALGTFKHRDTRPGVSHVGIKAETGVMDLQAKECQRLPENHQKQGKTQGAAPPAFSQGDPTLSAP